MRIFFNKEIFTNAFEKIKSMRLNIRVLIAVIYILYIVLLSIALITQVSNYYNNVRQTNEYRTKADNLQYDLKNNLKAANDRYTTEKLEKLFTSNDVFLIAHNLWTYGLYVNNNLISNTNALTINANDTISIRESTRESSLPAKIINRGNLIGGDPNDRLSNHLFVSGKKYSINETKKGNTITYTLKIEGLKSGDEFSLLMSDQLAKRLNLKSDKINITVV
jgi:hypothetical protein